jgi:fucokinase
VESIRPWTTAVTLTGAGGGGFMYILAKSAAARRIRLELERAPQSVWSRFYGFSFDDGGLEIERSWR